MATARSKPLKVETQKVQTRKGEREIVDQDKSEVPTMAGVHAMRVEQKPQDRTIEVPPKLLNQALGADVDKPRTMTLVQYRRMMAKALRENKIDAYQACKGLMFSKRLEFTLDEIKRAEE